ncbi:methyltransferase domain-containing protein [Candidatus Omnitrophota bacterium]
MVASTVLLKEKFSKASKNYDEISVIQREVADKLYDRIKLTDSVHNVLDVGIGTGYLSQRLKSEYPDLKVYGIDLAMGMLERSRQKILDALLVQSDAKHLTFKERSFDLVVSNLAYQWVRDLKQALQSVKSVLKDKGKIYFTIFSDNTLRELREVIFESSSKDIRMKQPRSIGHLPNKSSLEQVLKEVGFEHIKIGLETQKQYYANLLELLNWLKMIGANRYWSDSLYGGLSARNFIDSIAKKYDERFKDKGKIFATFEVIYVELIK